MAKVITVEHNQTGHTLSVYKHKERATYVDANNYTTEYPVEEVTIKL